MAWKAGASLAVLLCLAMPALAADMDDAEADKIPEYIPSEIASGWYVRGDATYAVSEPVYDFTLLGVETDNRRFGGGIGVGYRFSDWLRADLSAGYLGGDRYDFDDGVVDISATQDMWSGILSGYADLGTFAGFTPYVGAGLGVMHATTDISANIALPVTGLDERQTEFAFTLNAGVGYRVADKLTLDFGYQFISSPKTQYFDFDAATIETGVDQHQIRIGLRYDLW